MVEYSVKVITGASSGASISFAGGSVVIGRDPSSDLRINDGRVSRSHARLTDTGRDVVIHDLSSSNGTRVNGRNVTHALLRSGDVIGLGDSEVAFAEEAYRTESAELRPRQASAPPWIVGAVAAALLVIIIGAGAYWALGRSEAPPAAPIEECGIGQSLSPGDECTDGGFSVRIDEGGVAVVDGNIGGMELSSSTIDRDSIDLDPFRATRDNDTWTIESLPSDPKPREEPAASAAPAEPEPTDVSQQAAQPDPAPTLTPLECRVGLIMFPGDICTAEGISIRIDENGGRPIVEGNRSVSYSRNGDSWTITGMGP